MNTESLKKFYNVITAPDTQEYLTKVLFDKKESFVNSLTALVANNATLQTCDPYTVMYAAIKATALDLPFDPNLGFAYVIPYRDNKNNRTDAQFQIGYKGFIQLAQRSGQLRTINERDVREGEIIAEDFASGEMQFQKLPAGEREQAKVVGYVGYIELLNGFRKMDYWTIEQLDKHGRRYSKSFKGGVWEKDFEAMAKKTVIKLLLSKYAPLSIEMHDAIKFDQAVLNKDGEPAYPDNDDNAPEVIEAEQVADLTNVASWTERDYDDAVLKGQMSKYKAEAYKAMYLVKE